MDDLLAAGSRLGRYEIVRRLATGGMAEIYLARVSGSAGFAKHVVLKRIQPAYARDAEFVRMFLNEARYAATLDHPNIAHVHDFGEEGGLYYYAMEYLHGDDCRSLMLTLSAHNRRLPLEQALTIVIGAARGCHFAHEALGDDGAPLGLVHRDVSPSNVIITYAGAIKLVDFGIAKATYREDATAAGVTKGKLGYMAPEQCRAEAVDRRVDVYALGVLLYELTTGQRAFLADNDAAMVWAVISGSTTAPSAVVADYPPDLEAIVRKAMAVERDERFATARELADALEDFGRGAGLGLGPTRLGELFTEVMGWRPEPWRAETAEPRGRTTGPTTTLAGEELAATPPPAAARAAGQPARAGRHDDLARAAAEAEPVSDRTEVTPGAPVHAATGGSRLAWLAGAGVVLGAVAVTVWVVSRRDRAPAITVVTERGSTALEPGGAPVDAAPALDAAVAAAPTVDAAAIVDAAPAPRPPPERPGRPTGDPLSAAFARHQRAVNACFERHVAAGAAAPALTLRFAIDAGGATTSVEVLPPDVAASPLGGCVATVARAVRFPGQGAPAAFRIPISVTVQR